MMTWYGLCLRVLGYVWNLCWDLIGADADSDPENDIVVGVGKKEEI